MIRVVIIDDDYLVRLNLKMLLDWEKHGLTIVGEAENGQEGLKLIKELEPDFAIIDVKMPVMDGVELTEKIREMNIDVFYIMLSNYDEFEYVRSAMKNGAKDYLLKHKLNKVTLTEIVNGAVVEITAKKERNVQKQITIPNQKVEDFIMGLISGEMSNKKSIIRYISETPVAIGLVNVIPIVMVIDDYKTNSEIKGVGYAYKMKKNLMLQLNERLHKEEKGISLQIKDNKYVMILSFEAKRSQVEIMSRIKEILQFIQHHINVYYNISVTFSVGDMVNIEKVKSSYERASQYLQMKFYLGKGSIIDSTNSRELYDIDADFIITSSVEKQLAKAFMSSNNQKIEGIIKTLFDQMEVNNMNLLSVHNVIIKISSIMEAFIVQQNIPVAQVFEHNSPKQIVQRLETLEDFLEWLRSIFKKILQLISNKTIDCSSYIKETIVYIRRHYSENISLSLVAEQIGINSSYLSKIFKDEVGIGFNQFLCNERIKFAEMLMQKGDNDIKKIAKECGFNNYSYFFNVFKKKVGQTPKQYIASL